MQTKCAPIPSVQVGLLETADEAHLLARLRVRDEQAYEVLVLRYSARMLIVARRFLRQEHEAADAVQDAFIAAFKAIENFAQNSNLWTWLYRITVNACLMKIRSSGRSRAVSLEECLPSFDETGHHTHHPRQWNQDAHDVACRTELREQVRDCIDRLPEQYRAVILLRDIEQRDTQETAEILGCTKANVKTRLHRARQALRTLLEPIMSESQATHG
jgi:RNA polymerase sigma-70 factor, ECF subfamily